MIWSSIRDNDDDNDDNDGDNDDGDDNNDNDGDDNNDDINAIVYLKVEVDIDGQSNSADGTHF